MSIYNSKVIDALFYYLFFSIDKVAKYYYYVNKEKKVVINY